MLDERVLAKALAINNQKFIDNMPEGYEPHDFSKKFEKQMEHILRAQSRYHGRIWMERSIRFATTAAAVFVCLLTINVVSAKIFHVSLWNLIANQGSGYTEISFEKPFEKTTGSVKTTSGVHRYKLEQIPEGYQELEDVVSDGESTIQTFILEDGSGSITYIEGEITESILIDIEKGNSFSTIVDDKILYYEEQEDSIVAYFIDDRYYHMVTIQGKDATIETVEKIISQLEEQ